MDLDHFSVRRSVVSHRLVYIKAVGMQGAGLFPAGSSGVYRFDMCKRDVRLSRNSVAWAKALK